MTRARRGWRLAGGVVGVAGLAVSTAGIATGAPLGGADGTTRRVSVASDGGQANGLSGSPDVSGDGRYVVFVSGARNLVPGDTNSARDVVIRDRGPR